MAGTAVARPRARSPLCTLGIGALVGLWITAAGASEIPESAETPSSFVTVIDARAYEDRFATLEDLLDAIAGVRVRRLGGLGAYSTASIRGSKAEQVVVLLDGVRVNSVYRGGADLSTISLRSVDRIEITRGGGATRFGSDAVGGVISIRTRRGERAAQGHSGGVTLGDLRTRGFNAEVHSQRGSLRGSAGFHQLSSHNDFRFEGVPGPAEGRAVGSGRARNRLDRVREATGDRPGLRTTFRRQNTDFRSRSLFATGRWEPGRHQTLDASLHLFHKTNGQPGPVRGASTADQDKGNLHAREAFVRGVAALTWSRRSLSGGALRAQVAHRWERSGLDDPSGEFVFACRPDDPAEELESRETSSSSEVVWVPPVRNPVWAFAPRLVARARHDSVHLREDPRSRCDGPAPDRKHRVVLGGSAQAQVSWLDGRVRLIPALGYEWASTSAGRTRQSGAGFAPATVVDRSPVDRPVWMPHLGLIVDIAPGLRLKSNYLRAFRRPSFAELFHPDYAFIRGNPALEPEDAWNLDIGLELRPLPRWGLRDPRLEVVFFHRDVRDSIEWVLEGQTVHPLNTGPARVRGWEVSLAAKLGDRLELAGAYTHLDTELRATGGPLPHAPRNRWWVRAETELAGVRLWAEYALEDAFALEPTGRVRSDAADQLDLGLTIPFTAVPLLRDLPGQGRISLELHNAAESQRIDGLGTPLPGERIVYLRVRSTGPSR